MASKRSYGDPCGIARALDIVGERWALLVVRELVLGPKRFTDLRAGLRNLSPDVLAQRLRQLEDAGVVQRRVLPPPAGSRVYELTEWGRDLEPVLLALGRWGSRAALPGGDVPLGADALMLALPTLFDPSRAGGLSARYALRLGQDEFHARVHKARLDVGRTADGAPDAVISAEPPALAQVLWHDRPLDGSGVEVEGSRSAVERFLELFPLAA
jgi:DNA-binding HxlR family transcriptional regulator